MTFNSKQHSISALLSRSPGVGVSLANFAPLDVVALDTPELHHCLVIGQPHGWPIAGTEQRLEVKDINVCPGHITASHCTFGLAHKAQCLQTSEHVIRNDVSYVIRNVIYMPLAGCCCNILTSQNSLLGVLPASCLKNGLLLAET